MPSIGCYIQKGYMMILKVIKRPNPNQMPVCKHGRPTAGHVNGTPVCAECWNKEKGEAK